MPNLTSRREFFSEFGGVLGLAGLTLTFESNSSAQGLILPSASLFSQDDTKKFREFAIKQVREVRDATDKQTLEEMVHAGLDFSTPPHIIYKGDYKSEKVVVEVHYFGDARDYRLGVWVNIEPYQLSATFPSMNGLPNHWLSREPGKRILEVGIKGFLGVGDTIEKTVPFGEALEHIDLKLGPNGYFHEAWTQKPEQGKPYGESDELGSIHETYKHEIQIKGVTSILSPGEVHKMRKSILINEIRAYQNYLSQAIQELKKQGKF